MPVVREVHQRKSNAIIIRCGTLMTGAEVGDRIDCLLADSDRGGGEHLCVETRLLQHVHPKNRFLAAIDAATHKEMLDGHIPDILANIHIGGAAGGITGDGASNPLAVTEAVHLQADQLYERLRYLISEVRRRGVQGEQSLTFYVLASLASNTGPGTFIPVSMAARALCDEWNSRSDVPNAASLIGVVLLPERGVGAGAAYGDRLRAQSTASMLELRAIERHLRTGNIFTYRLGKRDIQVRHHLFDAILPMSSSAYTPQELAQRAGMLTALLTTDAAGLGAEFAKERVRYPAIDLDASADQPKVTLVGYGGLFLDVAALSEKLRLHLTNQLLNRLLETGTNGGQLSAKALSPRLREVADSVFRLPPIDAPAVLGAAPMERARAVAAIQRKAEDIAAQCRAAYHDALVARLAEALDDNVAHYLGDGQPLGNFAALLETMLTDLEAMATSWARLDAPPTPQFPDSQRDVAAINRGLAAYADDFAKLVWYRTVGHALLAAMGLRQGMLSQRVRHVLKTFKREVRPDQYLTRGKLDAFDPQTAQRQPPGVTDVASHPLAFARFLEANHPFERTGTDGVSRVPDQERLSRFLSPVTSRLVAALRDGDADGALGAMRAAVDAYFEAELASLQLGSFIATYIPKDDEGTTAGHLEDAVIHARPLLGLRSRSAGRGSIYIERPAGDPLADARVENLRAEQIDTARHDAEIVVADRPLRGIFVMQVEPNVSYEDLAVFAPNGEHDRDFRTWFEKWQRDRRFPLFTDARLQKLVAETLPGYAWVADRPPSGEAQGSPPAAGGPANLLELTETNELAEPPKSQSDNHRHLTSAGIGQGERG